MSDLKDRIARFRELPVPVLLDKLKPLLDDCQKRIEALRKEYDEEVISHDIEEKDLRQRLCEAREETRKLREALAVYFRAATGHQSYSLAEYAAAQRIAEAAMADKGETHSHTVSHDEQQAEQSDPCDICGVPRYRHGRPVLADSGGE